MVALPQLTFSQPRIDDARIELIDDGDRALLTSATG
jgi:hypothetical protein